MVGAGRLAELVERCPHPVEGARPANWRAGRGHGYRRDVGSSLRGTQMQVLNGRNHADTNLAEKTSTAHTPGDVTRAMCAAVKRPAAVAFLTTRRLLLLGQVEFDCGSTFGARKAHAAGSYSMWLSKKNSFRQPRLAARSQCCRITWSGLGLGLGLGFG